MINPKYQTMKNYTRKKNEKDWISKVQMMMVMSQMEFG